MLPTQQPQQQVARPVDVLTASLNAGTVQAQFKNALGEHKDAFVASIIDLYTGDKQLQQCKPGQIIAEALRAATLKLPLNKALGFAYIVVYKNKGVPTPTFIPGYKGYIQLAMRTGQYKTINADVVYEGEVQRANKLTGEIKFDGDKASDKIIGYFCHFELLNGFSKTLYMTVEEMAKYAKRYAPGVPKEATVAQLIAKANDGYASKQVGWMGNFNDMAIKTVVRRLLSKYGYLSVEMVNAVTTDAEHDAAADRNEALAEAANVEYIEVDSEPQAIADAAAQQEQKAETPEAEADDESDPY